MPGLIVDGHAELVRGLDTRSWRDDPRLRLRMGEDGAPRPVGTWIRAIVLHTTEGIPGGSDRRQQVIKAGAGTRTTIAERTNAWWSTNGQSGGAHLVVDFDGSVACLADLSREMTYHATSVNTHTIGIEIAQSKADAGLYAGQLDAVITLLDWMTARFGIQRQYHAPYLRMPVGRLRAGGRDCVGIYGHRDQTANRGEGDPGNAVFDALRVAGYEPMNFGRDEDLAKWRHRQEALRPAYDGRIDGVAGPMVVRALKARGYATGMWLRRPGDPGNDEGMTAV